MRQLLFFLLAAVSIFISCDDNTGELGYSIIDYEDNVENSATSYNLEDSTVVAKSIYARSSYCYLGKLYDEETKLTVTGNMMTQMATNDWTLYFPDSSLIETPAGCRRDSCRADSCFLILNFTSFYGDSLAKMKVIARELDMPYDEGEKYDISYDPSLHLREDGLVASCSFSISNKTLEGRKSSSSSVHSLYIPLNKPYTSIYGKKYNNYGSYLMDMYYNNKKLFISSALFKYAICPGFYVQVVSGQGALGKIASTAIGTTFTYRYNNEKDSTETWGIAGTKEVIQLSTITDDDAVVQIEKKANDPATPYTYVKSPVGIYTQLTLDIDSILADKYKDDSLSTVRIFIPRLNNETDSKYALDPPSTLLMVRADSINTFFNREKVIDNKTSYTASYSSSVNGYTFSNISTLVSTIYNTRKSAGMNETQSSREQYAKEHPKWNKVYLVPVETTSNSSGELTSVSHSMALQCAKLKKATKANGAIKASVIYSKFKKDPND